MLKGIDVSSYQSDMDVANSDAQFVVIKATEGTGYVNPVCDTHYQEAKASGKLRGVYHFAANKFNDAPAEAAYFVNNITGYIGDAILVLDYENAQDNDETNVAWALVWLREVERLTGVKPLIYMNASCVNSNDWSTVIANGNALWVAAYQGSAPDVNWPNDAQAMWQYSSSPIDQDDFWGDEASWMHFAQVPSAPAPQPAVPATPVEVVQSQPEPAPETQPSVPADVPATPAPEPSPAIAEPAVDATSPVTDVVNPLTPPVTAPHTSVMKTIIASKLSSRKLWLTVGSVIVLIAQHQVHDAVAVILGYLGVQGYVDSKN